MKAGVIAVAAAIASGVNAAGNHAGRRHAHQAFHMERNLLLTTGAPEPTCGCTTVYYTVTGAPTLYHPPPPATTSAPPPPPSTTAKPTPTSSPAPVVPTPFATTCPTTGVYTIPATTITLTESTTVCGATSTPVGAGTHTAGGVTTVVETSTVVVCPYATTGTSEGVVTSTILTTTYVCPSAGTYTIAPLTTTVTESTVWVYPTPASYAAGTYTQPEVVTTVTETDYVIVCPFTSPTLAPAPVYTSAAAPAPPASTYVAASPSASTVSSGGSLPGGELGSSGNQWGITYTPYTSAGLCKTAEEVVADITLIKAKGFEIVRVYSTDCSALTNIGSACAAKDIQLKMILGVFIDSTHGIAGAQEQVTEITAWAQWDLVELIIVGNEAVGSGACDASTLAGFVSSSKSAFKSAGYTGPVTLTETMNIWQENIELFCGVVDIVGTNIHAFFNPDTVAKDAGKFVKGQLELADNFCPGKYAINCETGWPSYSSECNGLACGGVQEQADAIKSLTEEVGGKSVMFSFANDDWKPAGQFGCEKSWGAIQLFG